MAPQIMQNAEFVFLRLIFISGSNLILLIAKIVIYFLEKISSKKFISYNKVLSMIFIKLTACQSVYAKFVGLVTISSIIGFVTTSNKWKSSGGAFGNDEDV